MSYQPVTQPVNRYRVSYMGVMGQTCEERAETCKAENTRHRGVMLVEGKAKVMDAGRRVVRDVLGGRGGEGRGVMLETC